MTDADMVEHVSRYCRVPIIDYARRESSGLLVGSGTGLMMAIMDQAQTFRWCIDLDVLDEQSRWEDWMLLVRAFVRPMAVVGWFSITRPQRLAAVVRRLRPAPGVYAAGVSAPDPFDDCEVRLQSVEQFIGWAAQAERPAKGSGCRRRARHAGAIRRDLQTIGSWIVSQRHRGQRRRE
jgi:hypothetical protein